MQADLMQACSRFCLHDAIHASPIRINLLFFLQKINRLFLQPFVHQHILLTRTTNLPRRSRAGHAANRLYNTAVMNSFLRKYSTTFCFTSSSVSLFFVRFRNFSGFTFNTPISLRSALSGLKVTFFNFTLVLFRFVSSVHRFRAGQRGNKVTDASKCTCLPSPSSRPTKCDKASSTASTSVSVSEQYSCICLRSSSVVMEPFSLIRGCRVSSSPCLSFVFGFSYQSN